MSRSNNTELVNPSKRFYEWVGSKGCLKFFDKTKGEKGENVEVALPFTFLVLDRLSTIKGFSDADKSGFWSNEVRDLKTEQLTVRTKKGVAAVGLYSTLAPVLNKGAQYCQSVYIAVKGADGKLELANIQFTGSSIGPWIDITKGKDIYKYAVTINAKIPAKKGTNDYFIPGIVLNPNVTEATNKEAIELDKMLQEYLSAYFQRNNSMQKENVAVSDIIAPGVEDYSALNTELAQEVNAITEPIDDLPF